MLKAGTGSNASQYAMNKNQWPNEAFIANAVRKALVKKGFKPQPVRSLHAHGADIVARHPKHRYYIFIECKGYPKGYSETAQRHNYFLAVLGQILLRMRQRNADYGVALPDHPFYRERILNDDFQIAREWLGLLFFLVGRGGQVQRLSAKGRSFSVYHK